MTERITEIEIKLAHLEQALQEMSDVMYAQQGAIDRLEQACEQLRQRVATGEAGSNTDPGSSEERPPHY